ncbi:hypothetical protein [Piscinibacter sp.]|jgi:hypothetical protein|uniref:hypothetical protein n=1 Tax=Piscinibacter sp. TaxID=1903157 RepID=UPI00355992FA
MNRAMTEERLMQETQMHRVTGGISAENRSLGFWPAFMDQETSAVYASCFGNGRPSPFHLINGSPDELVVARDAVGRAAAFKDSVIAGFVRGGRFYSRGDAGRPATGEMARACA